MNGRRRHPFCLFSMALATDPLDEPELEDWKDFLRHYRERGVVEDATPPPVR